MTTLAKVGCHQQTTQCKFTNENNERKVAKGQKFAHEKHETPCLSQWTQNHLKRCCGKQYIPQHGRNRKGGSLLDLEIGHKFNQSSKKTKGWGKPNLVCNTKEKTCEVKWKDGMIRWPKSHAPTLKCAQDLRHTQCELKPCKK